MNDFLKLNLMLNSLTIYKSLRNDPVISSIQRFCAALEKKSPEDAFLCYSNICSALFDGKQSKNLTQHIFDLIVYDDNLFSRTCARGDFLFVEREIIGAWEFEMASLEMLARIKSADIKSILSTYFPETSSFVIDLPSFKSFPIDFDNHGRWNENILKIAELYSKNGVGVFAAYKAFYFCEQNGITPIADFDFMPLKNFKHYTHQREQIIKNTLALINDKSFNNILLYGDRGTGKSSTVKAVLGEFKDQGLRIVQISKNELFALDKLTELIRDLPLKFIVFIDDLTFNENDDSYNMLKAILEGGLIKKPENMAIYATTNRRHIIKESFTGREGDEVHKSDTIDENLSLFDRFGLIITFTLPSKDTYLDIVRQMAADRKIEIDQTEMFLGAERFAMLKSGRSPRVAKQFIDSL